MKATKEKSIQKETQKIKTTSKSIKYDSNEYVKSSLKQILIYLIFLTLTTIVVNASHNLYMFYFNHGIKRLFVNRATETKFGLYVAYDDLVTTADWWSFVENTFLVDLHGISYLEKETEMTSENVEGNDTYLYGFHSNEYDKKVFLKNNILLSPPRLRQIRVQKNSCQIQKYFLRYFNTCYGEYSAEKEDRNGWYKGGKFFTNHDLKTLPIRAEIARYQGAGFVHELSFDVEKNKRIIQQLKSDKWIDRGTRLVIIEFVLFNANTQLFNNIKIMAEFLPTGGMITQNRIQSLKMSSLWQEKLYVKAAALVFYCMVVYFTYEDIAEMLELGIGKYCYSLWNLTDVLVLIFSYLSFVYNIFHSKMLQDILKSIPLDYEQEQEIMNFISIDKICFWNLFYIDVMGVLVFLVWLKMFKYISFSETMLQFSTTLTRCAKDLFGFAVMFFIVFLSYAQFGMLLFGTSHPDFRSFGVAIITLMRMFLGDFEYQLIEEASPLLGPVYFLTYVLFVFFILLNMFLAIINDTYGEVKQEIKQGRSQLGPYLMQLINKAYGNLSFSKKSSSKGKAETLKMQSKLGSDMELKSSGDILTKRLSELLREYFEELPPEFLKETSRESVDVYAEDIKRFNNRIILLENILETLIINMDRILEKVESKKKLNGTKKL